MHTDLTKRACYALFFVAILNIALGFLALIGVELLQSLGINWFNIIYGLVVGGVGVAAYKTHSIVMLGIGAAILACDLILTLGYAFVAGDVPPMGGTIVKVALIGMVLKPVIDDLRARRYRNF